MCAEKKASNSSTDNATWSDDRRLDTISESTYGPKEKSTVRRLMIPGSLLIKIWKRIFR